jgi:hypothetical protein
MGYVQTVLSGAVGDKYIGKPAPNKAEDVAKVQALLKKVFGARAPVFKDGVCDDTLKSAIADFQKIWSPTTDGTIAPNGQTLKRLDRLANPLVLKPITLGAVKKGGYIISYETCDGGPLPPAGKGYSLHLGFITEANTIDVTGRSANDLLGIDNLGQVLTVFEKLVCWSSAVQCRLYLKYERGTITTSGTQILSAPVRPHNGKMIPLDEVNNGSKLTYQGDPDAKDFHGRMFGEVPGYDKYVFLWAGKFETNNSFRGFDCITYVGTACGASNFHMADSEDLANSLGATTIEHIHKTKDPKTGEDTTVKVKLESADPAYVKEFFEATPTGYFLLWSIGHIVIVVDGEVHEFKASAPSGYSRRTIKTWLEPYKKMKLTVRRLSQKPARASDV